MASKKAPPKRGAPASKGAKKAKPTKARAPAPAKAKKPAPKAKPKPKPAKAPAKAAPKEPDFVKEANAAQRKAAMEALARSVLPTPPPAPPAPPPAAPPAPAAEAEASPDFVKEASPAARKAVVEALAQDAGVAPILARAPWRKAAPAPAPEPTSAPEAPREAPQPLRMTKPAVPAPAPRVGVSAKRPVILDTNALMMQFQFHIDIERELKRLLDFGHEIVVPEIVVGELETLAQEAKGKDAGEARMALELAKSFRVIESPGDGDTGILRLAEKLGNAVVVTNDKVLRARLRAKDIPNIYMRSSAFLTVEGHISGI